MKKNIRGKVPINKLAGECNPRANSPVPELSIKESSGTGLTGK